MALAAALVGSQIQLLSSVSRKKICSNMSFRSFPVSPFVQQWCHPGHLRENRCHFMKTSDPPVLVFGRSRKTLMEKDTTRKAVPKQSASQHCHSEIPTSSSIGQVDETRQPSKPVTKFESGATAPTPFRSAVAQSKMPTASSVAQLEECSQPSQPYTKPISKTAERKQVIAPFPSPRILRQLYQEAQASLQQNRWSFSSPAQQVPL